MSDRATSGQDGVVALETVLVLPLVALLLVAVLGSTVVVGDQLAVTRAARAGARAVAVTGQHQQAAAVARGVVPGARVTTQVADGLVSVEVRLDGSLLGVGYDVGARAVAPLEPVVR